jgi:CRP/FNR family cyclic AMP-dependent transcriptional regulator
MSANFADYLTKIPLFSDLSSQECMDMVRTFSSRNLEEGAVLCAEGEPGDAMYIIEKGQVKITKKTIQGDDEELARIGVLAVVGEMTLLDGSARSATVTAIEKTSCYSIDRKAFDILVKQLHPAAFKVIRKLALTLCERLRGINMRTEEFFADPQKSMRKMVKRQKEIQANLKERMDARAKSASGRLAGGSGERSKQSSRSVVQPLRTWSATSGTIEPDFIEFLKQLPLLEGFSAEDLQVLASALVMKNHSHGEVLCKEGDVGDSFFILGSGKAKVLKEIGEGEAQHLATLDTGTVLGEISLIDGKRRSATCVAEGNVILLSCNRRDFDALFLSGSSFAFRFIERIARDLSKRVRSANDQFTMIFSRPGQTLQELHKRVLALRGQLEGGEHGGGGEEEEDPEENERLMKMLNYKGR